MPDVDLPSLSHVDDRGSAQMVDVSLKPTTTRTAVAAGRVLLGEEAFMLVKANKLQKGDVLAVSNIAGIMGAKRTSLLVPLCHDVVLQNVDINFELDEAAHAVDVRAIAKTQGPTGVEMEALTAVSISALTIYDMCKSISKDIAITDLRLLAKSGGQSGDFIRTD